MIKVRYTDNEITAVGHSGYDELGKDIVCASVSASFKMAVGLLEKRNAKFKFESNDKPFIGIQIDGLTKDRTTRYIIETLAEVLKSIELEYPEYINVSRVYISNKKVQ